MLSFIMTRCVVERSCLFAVIVMVLAPILATFEAALDAYADEQRQRGPR